jgi:CRISPR-associated protein Csd2
MFEHDRSAARGLMATRGLYVWEHDNALGRAPAHKLFERIAVSRSENSSGPARAFSDFKVSVDTANLPEGVKLVSMV